MPIMAPINIITDKSELEGTCYIELSLGKYQGKHWEETSLFFNEDVFGLIEAIFEKHVAGYDHYHMNDADSGSWAKIIIELKELNKCVDSAGEFNDIMGKVGLAYADTRDYFQRNFQLCKSQLINVITELVAWAEVNIEKHKYIAILGI